MDGEASMQHVWKPPMALNIPKIPQYQNTLSSPFSCGETENGPAERKGSRRVGSCSVACSCSCFLLAVRLLLLLDSTATATDCDPDPDPDPMDADTVTVTPAAPAPCIGPTDYSLSTVSR